MFFDLIDSLAIVFLGKVARIGVDITVAKKKTALLLFFNLFLIFFFFFWQKHFMLTRETRRRLKF